MDNTEESFVILYHNNNNNNNNNNKNKTIHNNWLDITLVDKISKTVYFINIAIPNNHNLQAKYAEKLAKYSELWIEIKDQWKMDTVATIPVTLSTNGIIPKTLHKALNTVSAQTHL
jgi:hypothetical protein